MSIISDDDHTQEKGKKDKSGKSRYSDEETSSPRKKVRSYKKSRRGDTRIGSPRSAKFSLPKLSVEETIETLKQHPIQLEFLTRLGSVISDNTEFCIELLRNEGFVKLAYHLVNAGAGSSQTNVESSGKTISVENLPKRIITESEIEEQVAISILDLIMVAYRRTDLTVYKVLFLESPVMLTTLMWLLVERRKNYHVATRVYTILSDIIMYAKMVQFCDIPGLLLNAFDLYNSRSDEIRRFEHLVQGLRQGHPNSVKLSTFKLINTLIDMNTTLYSRISIRLEFLSLFQNPENSSSDLLQEMANGSTVDNQILQELKFFEESRAHDEKAISDNLSKIQEKWNSNWKTGENFGELVNLLSENVENSASVKPIATQIFVNLLFLQSDRYNGIPKWTLISKLISQICFPPEIQTLDQFSTSSKKNPEVLRNYLLRGLSADGRRFIDLDEILLSINQQIHENAQKPEIHEQVQQSEVQLSLNLANERIEQLQKDVEIYKKSHEEYEKIKHSVHDAIKTSVSASEERVRKEFHDTIRNLEGEIKVSEAKLRSSEAKYAAASARAESAEGKASRLEAKSQTYEKVHEEFAKHQKEIDQLQMKNTESEATLYFTQKNLQIAESQLAEANLLIYQLREEVEKLKQFEHAKNEFLNQIEKLQNPQSPLKSPFQSPIQSPLQTSLQSIPKQSIQEPFNKEKMEFLGQIVNLNSQIQQLQLQLQQQRQLQQYQQLQQLKDQFDHEKKELLQQMDLLQLEMSKVSSEQKFLDDFQKLQNRQQQHLQHQKHVIRELSIGKSQDSSQISDVLTAQLKQLDYPTENADGPAGNLPEKAGSKKDRKKSSEVQSPKKPVSGKSSPKKQSDKNSDTSDRSSKASDAKLLTTSSDRNSAKDTVKYDLSAIRAVISSGKTQSPAQSPTQSPAQSPPSSPYNKKRATNKKEDIQATIVNDARTFIMEGKQKEFEEILGKISNLNATDNEGNTLLHWCCACNQPNMARLLISYGAQTHPLIRNNFSETPLDLAKEHGDEPECLEIIDLFRGADGSDV